MKYLLLLSFTVLYFSGCTISDFIPYGVYNNYDKFENKNDSYMIHNFVESENRNDCHIGFNIYQQVKDNATSYFIHIEYICDNWMFIGKGNSLILLLDQENISLEGAGSGNYHEILDGNAVLEQAYYPVSKDFLYKIYNANNIEFKLKGDKYSFVRKLNRDNISRLKEFIDKYVK